MYIKAGWAVSEFKSDKKLSSLITLDYKLEPYKYKISDLLNGGEIIHDKLEGVVITNSKTVTISIWIFRCEHSSQFNNKQKKYSDINFKERSSASR